MSPNAKPMSFSVGLSPYDRWDGIGSIAQAAQLAEELGFFGVQFPEHIIMTVRPDSPRFMTLWYDNFVLAAHVATLTKRIRLNFNVMVVPYRPPVQTAKLVSTLDQVSQGRLILGVGVGWLRGEFRTLGIPFHERGAITDEYLRAMKVLWTEEEPSFSGKYTSFSNIAFEPKCVQKPHVPIWVGGSGPGPLRRVVELGDGWAPMVGSVEELARDVVWIKEQARAAGRDPEGIDFSYSISIGEGDPDQDQARRAVTAGQHGASEPLSRTPEEVIDAIGRHRDAGFNHMSIGFNWEKPADMMGHMEWFAAKVMPAFKS